ncbi:hypothetical protein Taro_024819 [Colocasia esculenta]|uniref:FLZ-type domain-containing protein n=1 Tax=Colocasia esculenta TaxID=4460 RepID=A0A843VAF5_COLES|nr:hypothetical protein [Colocasia esculenta]
MAAECPGRRPPPAGKLSLLVGFAESLSSQVPAAAEVSSRSPTPRSPRSFDYDGAVGLGIVAAMNDGGHPKGVAASVTRKPRLAPPLRSVPIPIVSAAAAQATARRKEWRGEEQEMEMALSESYTCVISHVDGAAVRKRVYFDDGAGHYCWGGCSAALWETPPAPVRPSLLPPAEDFLSRCFRCRKKLHGIDIFMYRGDKAFCSVECRCQQILSEERGERRVPNKAPKPPLDCSSVSPCSTPLFFAAGVAAA